MLNYLSVDLESWASPNLPEFTRLSSIAKKKLDNGHVKKSTLRVLQILKQFGTKVTFFTVGQIYEWYPELIAQIAKDGHEIAYHTHEHEIITDKQILIQTLIKSKKFIEKYKPVGFRAPRISINTECLSVLKYYGFRYDSSFYGPYSSKKRINNIVELPISSHLHIPVGSGYFIGLMGKKTKWLYNKLNQQNIPVLSFIHNWQVLKPKKATFPNLKYLIIHPYYFPYLKNCDETFLYLLKHMKFAPMKNLIE